MKPASSKNVEIEKIPYGMRGRYLAELIHDEVLLRDDGWILFDELLKRLKKLKKEGRLLDFNNETNINTGFLLGGMLYYPSANPLIPAGKKDNAKLALFMARPDNKGKLRVISIFHHQRLLFRINLAIAEILKPYRFSRIGLEVLKTKLQWEVRGYIFEDDIIRASIYGTKKLAVTHDQGGVYIQLASSLKE